MASWTLAQEKAARTAADIALGKRLADLEARVANLTSVTMGAPGVPKPPAGAPLFGTLITDFGRSDDEFAVGTKFAHLEAFWDDIETSEGVFSATALDWIHDQYNGHLAAGLGVVFEFGLHFPPAFYFSAPYTGASTLRFTNQSGNLSVNEDVLNVVFSQTARNKVERYVREVGLAVRYGNLLAEATDIRVVFDSSGESLYPRGNADGSTTGGLWGYGAAAQSGTDLATGYALDTTTWIGPAAVVCPLPGWTPGTGSVADASTWWNWYLDSLQRTVTWLINLFRLLGFKGQPWVVMPGKGTKPSAEATWIANRLTSGTADVERGNAWHRLADYMRVSQVVPGIWTSSVAESSGQTDITQAGDVNVLQTDSATINAWSAMRWQAYLAHTRNLPLAGENPGGAGGTSITSSSVANPTVITTAAAHGLTTGDTVQIAAHTGSTPSINGVHTATVTDSTHFTIPVNVTTGGTGGSMYRGAYGLTMMQWAVDQARAAGYWHFMWAHSHNLYDGTGGATGGAATLAAYATEIAS